MRINLSDWWSRKNCFQFKNDHSCLKHDLIKSTCTTSRRIFTFKQIHKLLILWLRDSWTYSIQIHDLNNQFRKDFLRDWDIILEQNISVNRSDVLFRFMIWIISSEKTFLEIKILFLNKISLLIDQMSDVRKIRILDRLIQNTIILILISEINQFHIVFS